MAYARKLHSVLRTDPLLTRMLTEFESIMLVQQSYLRTVPSPLGLYSRVIAVTDEELLLTADNGAIATKLKQLTPDLLTALQREGWQFTSIRVQVQVRKPDEPRAKRIKKQIDSYGIQSLQKLAARLENGSLKAALKRLVGG